MDPLTAIFNFGTEALKLGGKVWEATPKDLQAQSAGDWAKFTHNIAEAVLNAQAKLNALTK